jgi:outer membrane protein assembly factor BamA
MTIVELIHANANSAIKYISIEEKLNESGYPFAKVLNLSFANNNSVEVDFPVKSSNDEIISLLKKSGHSKTSPYEISALFKDKHPNHIFYF